MVSQFACVWLCALVILAIMYSVDDEGEYRLTQRQRLLGTVSGTLLALCAFAFVAIARWL